MRVRLSARLRLRVRVRVRVKIKMEGEGEDEGEGELSWRVRVRVRGFYNVGFGVHLPRGDGQGWQAHQDVFLAWGGKQAARMAGPAFQKRVPPARNAVKLQAARCLFGKMHTGS